MGFVKTNNVNLQYAIEAELGFLAGENGNPGTPTWYDLEPEDITSFGATLETVARNPISKSRRARKGTVVSLTSVAEFEHDLTRDAFDDFIEAFLHATYSGLPLVTDTLSADDDAVGGADGFNHGALSAAIPQYTLLVARGFTQTAIPATSLLEVDSGGSTTATPIVGATFTDEDPAATVGASLEVAGLRSVGTNEFTLVIASGVGTLTDSLGTLDFTTRNLTVGQFVHIGGLTSDFQLRNSGDTEDFYGVGRITAITATTLTFDKLQRTNPTTGKSGAWADGTYDSNPGAGARRIDLIFGQFVRDVDTDDAQYLERSFHFEASYPNLETGGATGYEYSVGNRANTLAIGLELQSKANLTFGFTGTDTQTITTTRKTNGGSPVGLQQTSAYNTSSDILRLRITGVDETGYTTCFKNIALTINNNLTPEDCLGDLGAIAINTGELAITIEGEIAFTSSDVKNAIRNNETVTMDTILKNGDGGMAIDIPSMTLGNGANTFPRNESVLTAISGTAFGDDTFGYALSVSMLPLLP